MTKQNRKERKEKLLAQRKKLGDESEESLSKPEQTSLSSEKEIEKSDDPQDKVGEENSLRSCSDKNSRINPAASNARLQVKRPSSCNEDLSEVGPQKMSKTDGQSAESSEDPKTSPKLGSPCSHDLPHMSWYLDCAWAQCFQKPCLTSTSDQTTDVNSIKENKMATANATNSDPAQTFPFPTIANKSLISLPQPWAKLLPSNVDVNEDYNDILIFNVEKYRREVGLITEFFFLYDNIMSILLRTIMMQSPNYPVNCFYSENR